MPTYRLHKLQDHEISIYPRGFRKCLRFFPYYSGSDINLTLKVKNLSGEKERLSYEWHLHRWDGTSEIHVAYNQGEFSLLPKGKHKENIDTTLFIPGEHNLKLIISRNGKNLLPQMWPVLASFGILERDIWVARGMLVILSVFGTIIAGVIGYFIGKGA